MDQVRGEQILGTLVSQEHCGNNARWANPFSLIGAHAIDHAIFGETKVDSVVY